MYAFAPVLFTIPLKIYIDTHLLAVSIREFYSDELPGHWDKPGAFTACTIFVRSVVEEVAFINSHSACNAPKTPGCSGAGAPTPVWPGPARTPNPY